MCAFKHLAMARTALTEFLGGWAEPVHMARIIGNCVAAEEHLINLGVEDAIKCAQRIRAWRGLFYEVGGNLMDNAVNGQNTADDLERTGAAEHLTSMNDLIRLSNDVVTGAPSGHNQAADIGDGLISGIKYKDPSEEFPPGSCKISDNMYVSQENIVGFKAEGLSWDPPSDVVYQDLHEPYRSKKKMRPKRTAPPLDAKESTFNTFTMEAARPDDLDTAERLLNTYGAEKEADTGDNDESS